MNKTRQTYSLIACKIQKFFSGFWIFPENAQHSTCYRFAVYFLYASHNHAHMPGWKEKQLINSEKQYSKTAELVVYDLARAVMNSIQQGHMGQDLYSLLNHEYIGMVYNIRRLAYFVIFEQGSNQNCFKPSKARNIQFHT